MVFIFVQSAMPGKVSGAESNIIVQFIAGITGWNEHILSVIVRKAAHFTEFLLLGICLSINMYDLAANHAVPKPLLKAWIIGTIYAVTDELHQSFVPGRACSFKDVAIDSAGVACGVLIFFALKKSRKNKQKQLQT